MRKPLLLLVFVVSVFGNSCVSSKIIIHNFSDIDDHKIFDERLVRNQAPAFHFKKNSSSIDLKKLSITLENNDKVPLDEFLSSRSTKALLVIKDDMILYENYFNGYNRRSIVTSFSVAKSFVSALVGIAIQEGHIQDIRQPLIHFLPELSGIKGFEKITLKHLLQMTSGVRFDERYRSPVSDVARFYYGSDLTELVKGLSVEHPPGLVTRYKSVDTQLLGMALRRATERPLAQYLEEKIWSRIGMESGAIWSVDESTEGMEKAFCCINALAVDFAKFGRLYLRKGNWEGEQIVPEAWVGESTQVNTEEGSAWWYQYQWWVDSPSGDFSARGLMGQYIYVNPKYNIIMVRFGDKDDQRYWPSFFRHLSEHIVDMEEHPELPFFFRELLFQDYF